MRRSTSRRPWLAEGPWAWLAAGGVALSLLMVIALLVLLAGRGLAHFWPQDIEAVTLEDGAQFAGQVVREQGLPGEVDGRERLYRTGNRDLQGAQWRWVDVADIDTRATPEDLVIVERRRWGPFIGRVVALEGPETRWTVEDGDTLWQQLDERLNRVSQLRSERDVVRTQYLEPLAERLANGEKVADDEDELQALKARIVNLQEAMQRDRVVLESLEGQQLTLTLDALIDVTRPNAMSLPAKLSSWGHNVWRFLSEGPRDANTAGGIWPAIFGTIMMVLLMSVLVMPFGVLAAIYLNEIAPQGRLTRLVRIGVRNLAGVPSIVYGVFGLGVFVYGIGGTLDSLFFADELPSPTFGTGGLLWASLTLALLTLPVVIVATEEGLARIPDAQREGALALGATRSEALRRVVLPMAVPAMLTGLILAVARAAGEVAPLMLVGVTKLASQVPVDGTFPFIHLERKFMHLGYHIFDAGFHGGDVESAMPLVYATALLLVLVILVLNLTAIFLRHTIRTRHRVRTH
ncbi:phosphate ABC transporter permease PstA [Aidingimonas halophila]|uniref:Phosphate transport system permease protein PstA n=1 Tax=Aidingimonas halophila TaxID=574349 RepID=A0A1H2XE41_9GAMM|nr:phosphate ABC transporter permease PstA [Aidingimonas halophila]GHC28568.1 phosphate transport system permease protein PstA [Aidingimonas halophila]SDW90988.1 phosphate transport system permease protein [Aidingimonas halophila]